LGLPAYQLLGGAARDHITRYLTLFPSMPQGRSWAMMKNCCVSLIKQAVAAGFLAIKMEMLLYELASDREMVNFIHECRQIVGEDREFMIDVGYRRKNSNDALWVLRNVEDAKLLFVETPLHTDDIDGWHAWPMGPPPL